MYGRYLGAKIMTAKQEIPEEMMEEITNWCVIREYNLTERDIAQLALDLYGAGYRKVIKCEQVIE